MQENWVRSLGWEAPLKKGMATHSSILAWKIPWTEEPDGLQSPGLQRVRHNWMTNTFTFTLSSQWVLHLILLVCILKKFKTHFTDSLKLEPITQSEVSQKDKHQYSILMHIYMEFRKMVMITLCKREKEMYIYTYVYVCIYRCISIHRCIEQTFGLYGRRRGWDDLREQHQNMYIIKCERDHQSRLDAWDKCTGLVHWEELEGSGGREVGGGIGMGNTCKSMADSCQCMAKNTKIL